MRQRGISIFAITLAAAAVTGGLLIPLTAGAQNDWDRESKHRQQKKNEWRNIGIGTAGLGLFGLIKGDKTLMFAGAAGALYSANRYEQDRKSQSKTDRARASYFSKDHFYRNGHRYNRKTVWSHGKKHYQFVRA
jgi:hypothetical protein